MTDTTICTTDAMADLYNSSKGVFDELFREVKELSRKKPDATISKGKVSIINRVLSDLLIFLKDEPEGKYLDELDDDALPQISDAVLIMVQFEAALEGFYRKYFRYALGERQWVTKELIEESGPNYDEDEE